MDGEIHIYIVWSEKVKDTKKRLDIIPGGQTNGFPSNITLFIAVNLENDKGIC